MIDMLNKYREVFSKDHKSSPLMESTKLGANLVLDSIQDEYDSLCPMPSEFKKRCADHVRIITEQDSYDSFFYYFYGFETEGLTKTFGEEVALPLGVDNRLCYWSIEDAKRIHGGEE